MANKTTTRNKKFKGKQKYQVGGRGPKNPNAKEDYNTKQGKYRKFGDDYSDTLEGNAKMTQGRKNDLGWYVQNEQILKDVARIPYNIPVGLPIGNHGTMANIPANEYNMAVPGIAVMDVIPTYGFAKSPDDPVNVAFAGMFTYIRSHTSSKFDWDDNTLAINCLATDSLYYTLRWYQRIFCTLPLWHQSNKYLAQALIEAQGIDYDDLMLHAAEFRTALNLRADRIRALKIPSGLYVFARHQWMFQNYYIEGPSTKDQIYCYRPAAYYIHTKDANGISKLECHRFLSGGSGTDGRLTVADMLRKLDAMLSPIFNDQYFNLISGYIEQAYEGKVMTVDLLPDQAIIPLVYNEEVLLQFKNAKIYPIRHSADGATYYDNTFDLEQQPASATDIRVCLKTKQNAAAFRLYRRINDDQAVHVDGTSPLDEQWNFYVQCNEWTKDQMITTPHADVDAGENMINTRLIPTISFSTGSSGAPDNRYGHVRCGTEWPVALDIFCKTYDNFTQSYDTLKLRLHTTMIYDPFATDGTPFIVTTRWLPMISKFRFCPELKLITRSAVYDPTDPGSESAVAPVEQSFFEVDNYALVAMDDMERMHEAAIMGMLRVPEIASSAI